MTIAVLAQPTNSPPRYRITLTSPDGSAFTAISLYRTANGVTTAVRVQPPPGPSPVIAYDYEAPWDTGVVYSATVTRAGVTETYTAASATLSPTFPWLIHPTTPALSIPLDQGLFSAMGVVTIGTVVRAALTTKHRILGAEFQLVSKTGPRAAPSFPIIAILRDQTPLLIQVPTAWGWDFDSGYFDVGDVSSDRVLQYGPEHRRVVTLQLESVQAPAGTQQPTRTWATLLGQYATWQAVSAAYATWTDELTDSRR
jgi:hypothetical protein